MAKLDKGMLGAFHADLLDQIAQTGSITHAARACGISYRSAWSHVDRLNTLSGRPVVERVAGGKSGGGTRLTPYGTGLLKAYRILQEKHARYVKGLRKGIQNFEDFQRLARGMSLKTSARNQLFGTVKSVKLAGLDAEVVLSLKGGDQLKSRITRRSAEDLRIEKGSEAYALIKANWVELLPPRSARAKNSNAWTGQIENIRSVVGRMEVEICLKGGEILVATWEERAMSKRKFEKGVTVVVAVDPAHVILGITDVPRF